MYPTKKLGEICKILLGGTPSRNNKSFWGGNNLWCSIADMKLKNISITKEYITDEGVRNSNVKLLKEGTLFMSFKLSLGKLAFAGKNLYTNEAIAGLPIKDSNELDKNFLYYVLSGYDFSSSGTDNSVKGATLNKAKLEILPIPLPPLPIQQKIVSKLDASFANLNHQIDLLKQNISNIEELNKSVLENILNEEKFELVGLTEVSNFYNKGVLPRSGEVYNYVGLENIESNTGRLVYFSKTKGNEIKSNKVQFLSGMVLYGKLRPYLNKVWVSEFDGVATTEILPIECGTKLDNQYLSYYLRSEEFVSLANSNIAGARMPRITTKFLKENIKIPLPSLQTQKEIVSYLDQVFEKNKAIKQGFQGQIVALEELKQSLLKDAFEGRLVRE